MSDLLVKLYELPPLETVLAELQAQGIIIRRALAPEKHVVVNWVEQHFSPLWRSECDVSFGNNPPTCFVAIENEQMLGFACYETTQKNFFGPTGVAEAQRRRGVGKALLLVALHDMRAMGYAYAIIGAAGPLDFYKSLVGAVEIEGSVPGIYKDILRE